jgi:D-alanyl-D-alanine dipeptidase/carboxypeptidase
MKKVSLPLNSIHRGNLILVNSEYPYQESVVDKTPLFTGTTDKVVFLERQYARIYTKLIDDLCAWEQITPVSGWRSQQEQEQIYNESLLENGVDFTAKYVASPGHSEHQTGLAVDLALNQPDIDFLRPYFPYTGICGVFREKALHFGFIERYPMGKEEITGIAHEPWHFRYVGAPHAMIMNSTGDTLEEYQIRLKQFSFGSKPLKYAFGQSAIEIFYLPAKEDSVTFEVENDAVFTVSGNNMDGFVLTFWRQWL